MNSYLLLQADARHIPLADESVNCVVTSPPYFGQRDYGVEGQIGNEPDPDAFVASMVAVFREVWRVLRNDGTLWLNLGDSYAMTTRGAGGQGVQTRTNLGSIIKDRTWKIPAGLKQKDLIGIPWRTAFALQADGWWLRSEIIWSKVNPMPESVQDRPTKAHEHLFLLAKSERYYYDLDAIRKPVAASTVERDKSTRITKGKDGPYAVAHDHETPSHPLGRNERSVWDVATVPFKGSHFATMPPKLAEPCVKAGCPKGGVVLDPFNGAATTGVVSLAHGRRYVGLDLNADYLAMSRRRIERPHAPVQRAKVATPDGPHIPLPGQRSLFDAFEGAS